MPTTALEHVSQLMEQREQHLVREIDGQARQASASRGGAAGARSSAKLSAERTLEQWAQIDDDLPLGAEAEVAGVGRVVSLAHHLGEQTLHRGQCARDEPLCALEGFTDASERRLRIGWHREQIRGRAPVRMQPATTGALAHGGRHERRARLHAAVRAAICAVIVESGGRKHLIMANHPAQLVDLCNLIGELRLLIAQDDVPARR